MGNQMTNDFLDLETWRCAAMQKQLCFLTTCDINIIIIWQSMKLLGAMGQSRKTQYPFQSLDFYAHGLQRLG
jgi:hypothetical protein